MKPSGLSKSRSSMYDTSSSHSSSRVLKHLPLSGGPVWKAPCCSRTCGSTLSSVESSPKILLLLTKSLEPAAMFSAWRDGLTDFG
eukprot:CAMPEP_0206132150 /NCGR_PEP_ID=MMETSP1472-20131121/48120_1 /ASSEMBLY_ACC=CAM_ASM_001108 /TAXON_ID=41880 /ORGANISM="Pycnococcus provasolii, Strain RCC251" /LENGTH=84 /DNA_ID=CAMNT_0053523639 /DNA_START=56 /DNA_END=306 /DNA_ORIENTATION=+